MMGGSSSIELCEQCDGATLYPATEIVTGKLVCHPCALGLANPQQVSFEAEVEAVMAEDAELDRLEGIPA
jgi:hypothetical protein